MFIFCLDDSVYNFVKCLSGFEKNKCKSKPKDYFEYLSSMSVEELNKEYDLLKSFKYEFKYLSNSIVSELFKEIKAFDENNIKESLDKLYKKIEKYLLDILDIINGRKIRIIEGVKYKNITKDDVFAFATTVIGASDDVDSNCFGVFDDLLYLLHYFADYINDLTYSLFEGEFSVEFQSEINTEDMLIGRFSDISYNNKEVRKELFDVNGNIIKENVKYELLRGLNSLMDDYNEYNMFITLAINELNTQNDEFHFWEEECEEMTFSFISDDINELVFNMDVDF